MKAEADIIQSVIEIAEKHCAHAGREFKIDKSRTDYWFLFGSNLHTALISHCNVLKDARYMDFLRRVFEEIFDFLMVAYDGEPACTIYELSRAFGSCIDGGPTLPRLLPAKAKSVLEKASEIAGAEWEEERRRMDQSGY